MKRQRERGGSVIEFAIVATTLVPLIIGTGVLGVNMIKVQQTVQVAQDAGRMLESGLDMSQPGNQTILTTIATDLGLSATPGQGNAVVIFSALTYVDTATCAAAGQVDQNGVPTSGCVNYQHWVFTLRLTIGNSGLRTSNLGSPLSSGPNNVPIASNGTIALTDYVTNSGDVAQFSGINPYSNAGGNVTGLPSGQFLYVAEVAASAFNMGTYNIGSTYAFGIF